MNLFLDANVLVSVLNKEYPIYPYSSRIMSLGDQSKYKLYTSPLCLAIAFYFSEKKSGSGLAKEKIILLADKLHFTSISQDNVKAAVNNKMAHDIENGMQYYSALDSTCDLIITEDSNAFYFSELEVLNCRRFLENYIF